VEHDVLGAYDPVAAEAWGSQLLGALGPQLQATLAGQDVPPFEDAIPSTRRVSTSRR